MNKPVGIRRESSHLSRGLMASGRIRTVRAASSALRGVATKESQARVIIAENQDNPFVNGTLFNQKVDLEREDDIFDKRLKSKGSKKINRHYPIWRTLVKIFTPILALVGAILFAFLMTYLILQII